MQSPDLKTGKQSNSHVPQVCKNILEEKISLNRTKSFWLGTSDMKPRGNAYDPETLNNIRVNMKSEMGFSLKKENSF